MAEATIPRRATYDDYCRFPDDGNRYEILAGRIFMTPSPSPQHQHASKRLQRILERYFEDRLGYQVFNAPLDVILADDDVVQPDLLVVASSQQVSGRGIEGAPLLHVEILSPARPEYDRFTKASRYAVRGVPHYWLVDPDARTIECFRLDDAGVYRLEASATGQAELVVPVFEGLRIPLGDLWFER